MELLEQDVKAFQKPTENPGLKAHRQTKIEAKDV